MNQNVHFDSNLQEDISLSNFKETDVLQSLQLESPIDSELVGNANVATINELNIDATSYSITGSNEELLDISNSNSFNLDFLNNENDSDLYELKALNFSETEQELFNLDMSFDLNKLGMNLF